MAVAKIESYPQASIPGAADDLTVIWQKDASGIYRTKKAFSGASGGGDSFVRLSVTPVGQTFADITAGLAASFAVGGYISRMGYTDTNLATPLTVRRGCGLAGNGANATRDTPNSANGEQYMLGTILRPGVASMTYMIRGYDDHHLQHSVQLRDFSIDMGKTAYGTAPAATVANGVAIYAVGGRFYDLNIQEGTGTAFSFLADEFTTGGDPCWVNRVNDCNFTGCQYGTVSRCTDSWFHNVYFSTNSANNAYFATYGANRITGCTFETAGGYGLVTTGADGGNGTGNIIANSYFNINHGDKLFARNPNRPATEMQNNFSIMHGNMHHITYGDGIHVGAYIQGGLIGTEMFDGVQGADIYFEGNNPGWVAVGLNSRQPAASRYGQIPDDLLIISGGPGGQYNQMQCLTLAGAGLSPLRPTQAILECYGYQSVLGQAGTIMRMGLQANKANADAALLFGSENGNGFFMKLADGEAATANQGLKIYRPDNSIAMRIYRTGQIDLASLSIAPNGVITTGGSITSPGAITTTSGGVTVSMSNGTINFPSSQLNSGSHTFQNQYLVVTIGGGTWYIPLYL